MPWPLLIPEWVIEIVKSLSQSLMLLDWTKANNYRVNFPNSMQRRRMPPCFSSCSEALDVSHNSYLGEDFSVSPLYSLTQAGRPVSFFFPNFVFQDAEKKLELF